MPMNEETRERSITAAINSRSQEHPDALPIQVLYPGIVDIVQFLKSHLPPSAGAYSHKRHASRQRLSHLAGVQLYNLATDAKDEMSRRRTHTSQGQRPAVRTDLSKNRNIGRHNIAALPLGLFEELCYDVCSEITRRQPGLGELEMGVWTVASDSSTERDSSAGPAHRRLMHVTNAEVRDSSDSEDDGMSEILTSSPELSRSLLPKYAIQPSRMAQSELPNDDQLPREKEDLQTTKIFSKLIEIFGNRSKYKVFLGYRDQEAQAILNLLQALLDYGTLKPKFKKELAIAVQRLSERSALIPECFSLKGVELEGDYPVSSGRFGEVWKGKFQGQSVSLKVIKAYRDSQMHQLLKAFSREAVLWGQLSHPNLLPFYGIFHLGDNHRRICLVSPWMENGNISDFLDADQIFPRNSLVRDIAAGICYLHLNNVVHGDLKGANILVNSARRACLADFGLSTIRDPEVVNLTSSNERNGGGTIRWMAPELLDPHQESQNTKFTDIYSFACVCYEVYTGHVPFYEIHREQTVMLKIQVGIRPSKPQKDHPAFHHSGLTNEIWELMEDCWSQKPDHRPTAASILQRLPRRPKKRRPVISAPDVVTPAYFRVSMRGELNTHLADARILRLLDINTSSLL